MMIHWGVYSQLGGFWRGRRVEGLGEWVRRHATIGPEEYRELAAAFDPQAFDAPALVRLARSAGMRYLVFTAKHHDGFALFDSSADGFNSVRHATWGRDAAREVADACHAEGMRFGLYYSHAIDWNEPNAAQHWDDPEAEQRDFNEYFERKSLPQICELLTQYGQVDVLWPDMPFVIRPEQCQAILELVRRLQPGCLVGSRLGWTTEADFLSLGDNEVRVQADGARWETAATLNDTWGYRSDDHAWKSPAEVLRLLLMVAERGGNLLLNVGPDGDGRAPEGSEATLREVGSWLERHGEALFGCSASPFPYDLPSGPVVLKGESVHFFVAPGLEFVPPAGLPQVLEWARREDEPFARVSARLAAGGRVDPMPQPQGPGEIGLPSSLATCSGDLKPATSGRVVGGPGALEWQLWSPGGRYRVWARTVSPHHRENGGSWEPGGRVAVEGLQPREWRADRLAATPTSRYYQEADTDLGVVELPGGSTTLRLDIIDPLRAQLVGLRLEPEVAGTDALNEAS